MLHIASELTFPDNYIKIKQASVRYLFPRFISQYGIHVVVWFEAIRYR